MGVYFRTDTTQLTFAEMWRIHTRLPVFLTARMHKILGIRRPARHALYHEEAVVTVLADEVAPAAWHVIHPQVEAFERHGARLLFYHTVRSTPNVAGFAATLLPAEHNAIATVTWARSRIGGGPGKTGGGGAITSHLEDGRFFITSNHRPRFNSPPLFTVQRLLGAAPDELLDRHQEALADSGVAALPVENERQAIEQMVEAKRANFSWHVSRGVWVPLTPAEREALGLPADELDAW